MGTISAGFFCPTSRLILSATCNNGERQSNPRGQNHSVTKVTIPYHSTVIPAILATKHKAYGIMTAATLHLVVIPKRMLSKTEAAHHCGRPIKRFEAECPVAPVEFPNGDLRWDIRDLDSWLDSFKANTSQDDSIVERLT